MPMPGMQMQPPRSEERGEFDCTHTEMIPNCQLELTPAFESASASVSDYNEGKEDIEVKKEEVDVKVEVITSTLRAL